jgi:hypothetical protein
LIRVPSPERDISANHVEIEPVGDHVLVRDLSTNGTLIILPGRPPERLRRLEAVPIPSGTQIHLNESTFVTYEDSE